MTVDNGFTATVCSDEVANATNTKVDGNTITLIVGPTNECAMMKMM